jgi:hypothetical protein
MVGVDVVDRGNLQVNQGARSLRRRCKHQRRYAGLALAIITGSENVLA